MTLRFMLTAVLTLLALKPFSAYAHCDGLDGPVVQAGRRALETGDIRPALAWVRAGYEVEIRDAFSKTLAVRKLSTEGQQLADRYFFETLVRVHRAGENAPYDGLKPAGRDLGPAIPAADRAVTDGSAEPVLTVLRGHIESGIRERLERVMKARKSMNGDVETGRAYVAAYVDFIHFVERVHDATATPGGHVHE